MKYKLPKEIKMKMIREIKQYEHNKKKLQFLKDKNQESTRNFLYLEEKLYYVEQAYMNLNDSEKDVYNKIFRERCNWKFCQTIFNIDKDTYYKVFNKSLYLLAEEWGEI